MESPAEARPALQRVADEIHDDVLQVLSTSVMRLSLLERGGLASPDLEVLKTGLMRVAERLQGLLLELDPEVATASLRDSLQGTAALLPGLALAIGDVDEPSPPVRGRAARAAMEVLGHLARAGATHAGIAVRGAEGATTMEVDVASSTLGDDLDGALRPLRRRTEADGGAVAVEVDGEQARVTIRW